MDIGVLLPTGKSQWGAGGDPRELVAFAVHAERLGFSSLFVNDPLISPRIEALTMLAALAPVTERIGHSRIIHVVSHAQIHPGHDSESVLSSRTRCLILRST